MAKASAGRARRVLVLVLSAVVIAIVGALASAGGFSAWPTGSMLDMFTLPGVPVEGATRAVLSDVDAALSQLDSRRAALFKLQDVLSGAAGPSECALEEVEAEDAVVADVASAPSGASSADAESADSLDVAADNSEIESLQVEETAGDVIDGDLSKDDDVIAMDYAATSTTEATVDTTAVETVLPLAPVETEVVDAPLADAPVAKTPVVDETPIPEAPVAEEVDTVAEVPAMEAPASVDTEEAKPLVPAEEAVAMDLPQDVEEPSTVVEEVNDVIENAGVLPESSVVVPEEADVVAEGVPEATAEAGADYQYVGASTDATLPATDADALDALMSTLDEEKLYETRSYDAYSSDVASSEGDSPLEEVVVSDTHETTATLEDLVLPVLDSVSTERGVSTSTRTIAASLLSAVVEHVSNVTTFMLDLMKSIHAVLGSWVSLLVVLIAAPIAALAIANAGADPTENQAFSRKTSRSPRGYDAMAFSWEKRAKC
jgi:hypothetical protein